MKKRDLLDMLGDIDSDMIDDAAPDFSKKRRKKRPQNTYMKAIAIAACCTLILCGAMVAAPVINKIVYPDVATTDTGETGSVQATEDGNEGNNAPSCEPTGAPTEEPTVTPTDAPVVEDTHAPTEAPTDLPIEIPTEQATSNEEEPTGAATEGATRPPTGGPIEEPTEGATRPPTGAPIEEPTVESDDNSMQTEQESEDNSYQEPPTIITFGLFTSLAELVSVADESYETIQKYIETNYPDHFINCNDIIKAAEVITTFCIPQTKSNQYAKYLSGNYYCDREELNLYYEIDGVRYRFTYRNTEEEKHKVDEENLLLEDVAYGDKTVDVYMSDDRMVGLDISDGIEVIVTIFSVDTSLPSSNMFDVFDFVMLADISEDFAPDLDNEEPTAEPTAEPTVEQTEALTVEQTEEPTVEPTEGRYPELPVTISVESYGKLNKIFEISRGTLEEFKEYQKKCIEEKNITVLSQAFHNRIK